MHVCRMHAVLWKPKEGIMSPKTGVLLEICPAGAGNETTVLWKSHPC